MLKWEEVMAKLATSSKGAELDDYIDELVDHALSASTEPEMVGVFLKSFALAQSELTLRSTSLAVAITAEPDDAAAADALVAAFRQHREHSFLAPMLLDALALLAVRNPIARAETASILIRLSSRDNRYLLIKGAQIIARLDALGQSLDLRQKLHELSTCSDLVVRAEVAIQHAYLELADTLLSSNSLELHQRLAQTQAAFARAERMEEHRPDATPFACLVEMLLVFDNFTNDRISATQRLLEQFDYLRTVLAMQWWPSYRSEAANVCVAHALRIGDALKCAVVSASDADNWTNLDGALTELAALYAAIRTQEGSIDMLSRASTAYAAIADVLFAPRLGPVLRDAVGRQRLAKVTEKYVMAHGEDEYAAGLRAFEQSVAVADHTQSSRENAPVAPADLSTQLAQIASILGQTPEVMFASFLKARRQGADSEWAQQFGLGPIPLSVDRPEAFGGDRRVHEVASRVLNEMEKYLNPYPPLKWQRLFTMVETIVSFSGYVFDALPEYTKCQEDGGKGQAASEEDLQKDLFRWLRQRFGDNVVYESTPLGGGRVDTGLTFPECKIPIEVKHEFSSIRQEHVRANYLTQADTYAAATDRVSFLLILDLRDTHARKHRTRVSKARGAGIEEEIVSQYSWQEGFWVDALPVDPQVLWAQPKAVVIGVIPGNRPTPSSTTRYSKRPSYT